MKVSGVCRLLCGGTAKWLMVFHTYEIPCVCKCMTESAPLPSIVICEACIQMDIWKCNVTPVSCTRNAWLPGHIHNTIPAKCLWWVFTHITIVILYNMNFLGTNISFQIPFHSCGGHGIFYRMVVGPFNNRYLDVKIGIEADAQHTIHMGMCAWLLYSNATIFIV